MGDPFSIELISHTNFDLIQNIHDIQFSKCNAVQGQRQKIIFHFVWIKIKWKKLYVLMSL